MFFESLVIANVRCLERLVFQPAAGVTLVAGENGSGKTTLLEAIALASWGKSFQSNRALDIVKTGAPGLSVKAVFVDETGQHGEVQVRKQGGTTTIALDGQAVAAASVLAQRLPLVVVNSKAADILTENPSNRRALIDRTMFHVEPAYVVAWKIYRQALRQRNELLRRQARPEEAAYWDEQLAEQAARIDDRRLQVVGAINAALKRNQLSERLGPIGLHYAPGWKRERSYQEQLREAWPRDCRLGHTSIGIHRADIALRVSDRAAARRLSRGQGKFIVTHMLMSLAAFIRQQSGRAPVILVDDLAAELDVKMRAALVDIIDEQGGQRIYTAMDPNDLPTVACHAEQMFHVEQVDPPSRPETRRN